MPPRSCRVVPCHRRHTAQCPSALRSVLGRSALGLRCFPLSCLCSTPPAAIDTCHLAERRRWSCGLTAGCCPAITALLSCAITSSWHCVRGCAPLALGQDQAVPPVVCHFALPLPSRQTCEACRFIPTQFLFILVSASVIDVLCILHSLRGHRRFFCH
jgi:hypothetical protein